MALPAVLPRTYRTYVSHLTDVSTESDAYVPVVARCRVKTIYTVLQGAVTGTSTMGFSIGSTAITGATIADVGQDAATVASCTPTAANVAAEGQVLKAHTDGGSTNTIPLIVTYVVEEF
jgi:hypothetical protein